MALAAAVCSRGFGRDAIRRELLEPWRRGAGTPYRRRRHDLATDLLVDEPSDVVPDGDAQHPDQRRYLDAQAIYRARCRPVDRADVVIDDPDPTAPRIR